MKVQLLDAHDRLKHFTKQEFNIAKCCESLISQRPFGDHAFYIFAHTRTIGMDEKVTLFNTGKYASFDQIPEKRMIWQPRLTKPAAQLNSMLFKAYPGSDNIKIIWMIPQRELWTQFRHGMLTENKTVLDSIYDFEYNRGKLEAREPDDLSEEAIRMIYDEISRSARAPKYEMV